MSFILANRIPFYVWKLSREDLISRKVGSGSGLGMGLSLLLHSVLWGAVFWERLLLSNKRRITWEVVFVTQPPVPGPWICVKWNRGVWYCVGKTKRHQCSILTLLSLELSCSCLPLDFLVYEIQLFFTAMIVLFFYYFLVCVSIWSLWSLP